jgi:tripartite-type tricarboxylate transporter receptor subunit TctC
VHGLSNAQETYPTRPIELVVPFSAGGSADIAARIYSEELSRALKVPITVINRAGGAGIQGTTYVVRGKKDGYTLLAAPSTAIVVMPVISNECTYDPLKDLVPLAHFVSAPTVFDVKADSPFKNLPELLEYARKNPGKLKNATGGIGTESHLNLEILCRRAGVKITTVPFASGGEAVPALLGGHVDMSSQTLITEAPHIKAGKLRGLALASPTRHPDFPEIPCTAELGYPNVNLKVRFGVYAPAGVPGSVIQVLGPALEKVLKNPDVIDRANKALLTVEYMGPDAFRKFTESELHAIERAAKDANIIKK